MDTLIDILPKSKKISSYINDVSLGKMPINLSGLTDVQKAHIIYATNFYTKKPFLVITYNEIQAKKLTKDIQFFDKKTLFFPKKEISSFDIQAQSKDALNARGIVLNSIVSNKNCNLVTTIESLMQRIISKEEYTKNILKIVRGKEYNLEELKQTLINLGYERADIIEGKGQFSARGGILDISPVDQEEGIRIEFFGDEVDSIRKFNILSQRSNDILGSTKIYPAGEYVIPEDIEKVCRRILDNEEYKKYKDVILEDIECIREGSVASKAEKYFGLIYRNTCSLIDYLTDEYLIFIDESSKIKQRCEWLYKGNLEEITGLLENSKFVPEGLRQIVDYEEFLRDTNTKNLVYLESLDSKYTDMKNMHAKRNGYSLSCREVNFFRSTMDLLPKEIKKWQEHKKTIIIINKEKSALKKIEELLNNDNEIIYKIGELSTGFTYEEEDLKLVLIDTNQIFTTKKKSRAKTALFKQGEKVIFADLNVGDYVVHNTHGIGKYIGVQTLTVEGIKKDYIKIAYKGDDILYIPTNQLDNIRKYLGGDDYKPKLSKMGGKDWEKAKAKVKESLKSIAADLILLYAKRKAMNGYAFSPDTTWQEEFEGEFSYDETEDQIRCIKEVKEDMEKSMPMDRLLCGDVGYGKTEVALRAAFKACMDNKQVAYLVPTTILANQQYLNFCERLKNYPIQIELLNRFKTKKEQKDILKRLELGEVNIVIGTHRLLQKDVKYKDLGFLIVDEEHRFGVEHKEIIKGIKNNVDVLTMSATPIPRTLHMSIVGAKDMSVIYDPPKERIPVKTYVMEYDSLAIKEAIIKEVEREGQVFYLYNKVETIIKKTEEIRKMLPELKISYAHGKMTGTELEDTMLAFINHEIDVLVCTTILESGIDIPNANTIIVENADNLGLAQLYQIRGRVGRADRQAYAYVTYRKNKMLTEVGYKRLQAIKEFTEFGSGFKIAMRDLEIRGAGNILGAEQHGHMEAVGYDMYCKLLEESVKELETGSKDDVLKLEEQEIAIDINVSAYIPDTYIDNNAVKIEMYQNIALAKTNETVEEITDEIIDRFGDMPQEVELLIKVAYIKILARKAHIYSISQKKNNLILYFNEKEFNVDVINILLKKYKRNILISPNIKPYITYTLFNNTEENILKELEELLKTIL